MLDTEWNGGKRLYARDTRSWTCRLMNGGWMGSAGLWKGDSYRSGAWLGCLEGAFEEMLVDGVIVD